MPAHETVALGSRSTDMSNISTPSPLFRRLSELKNSDKPSLARLVLRVVSSARHFHSPKRLTNAVEVAFTRGVLQGKSLTAPSPIGGRTFHATVVRSEVQHLVVKIPRADNQYGSIFLKRIRDSTERQRYERVIRSLQNHPTFGSHCPKLIDIRDDGGYTSEFVEGHNLADLQNQMFLVLEPEQRTHLRRALERLAANLEKHLSTDSDVGGDWSLHNLIYSPTRDELINVDLEGFYTFSMKTHRAEIASSLGTIKEVLEYLRLDRGSHTETQVAKTLRVIHKVQESGSAYAGQHFFAGYHTLELDGIRFVGQRDCHARIRQVPFDFRGKVVVDLGCNSGGMLHALSSQIEHGYGFDYNPKCINAATRIKSLNKTRNVDFYQFNLDSDPLQSITDYVSAQIDIVLLLSVCMWLVHWQEVIQAAAKMAPNLLFETNGSDDEQQAQLTVLNAQYREVRLLSAASLDDPLQARRQLYLCRNETDQRRETRE